MSQKDTKPVSTNASREMIIQKMARDYNAMKAAKDALEQQNNELLGKFLKRKFSDFFQEKLMKWPLISLDRLCRPKHTVKW